MEGIPLPTVAIPSQSPEFHLHPPDPRLNRLHLQALLSLVAAHDGKPYLLLASDEYKGRYYTFYSRSPFAFLTASIQ